MLEQSLIFLKFWDTTSVDIDNIAESPPPLADADKEAPQEISTSTVALPTPTPLTPAEAEERGKYHTLTPFMKEAFPDLDSRTGVSRQELTSIGKEYVKNYKKVNRDKLLTYMKSYDLETALNALFVLSEEK